MPKLKQIGIDVDVNRAIESNRQTFAETENDILRRMLLSEVAVARPKVTTTSRGSRQRGEWLVQVRQHTYPAANLKDAYCELLRRLAKEKPNFMQQFGTLKSRSRRFVARDPASLYEKSPHLAKDHAFELMEGWYVDTNLSTDQVSNRARSASSVAGLSYGADVKITESGRLI